jgi:nucleotide-binding universal stress UspA family protein
MMSDPVARPAEPAPILAGTDGSPPADRAVAWAADEAALRRRPLHLVHVTERWMYDIPLFPAPGMRDSLSEEGLRILARAKDLALDRRPDLTVTTELVEEATAHALNEASEHAFEVVLGHRGLGGFASLLLGSTGLRVAGHAFGPVIIVRGEETGTGAVVKGEVVVGTDVSEGSAEALEYAFDAAAVRKARLRVIHSWRVPAALLASGDAAEIGTIEERTRLNLAQSVAPCRDRHPDVHVVEELVREHPVSALVDVSGDADLVVVGSHGHTGRGAIRLGSVGHGVIHHAHCPVAVVRPRG